MLRAIHAENAFPVARSETENKKLQHYFPDAFVATSSLAKNVGFSSWFGLYVGLCVFLCACRFGNMLRASQSQNTRGEHLTLTPRSFHAEFLCRS
jgi:hypothetical protein